MTRWSISALLCFTPLLGLAHSMATETCNELQPQLGNCGEEDRCDERSGENSSQAICEGTYADYHQQFAGIACTTGTAHNFCEQTQQKMDCTCEFFCEWTAMTMVCDKGDPHTVGGEQVCGEDWRFDSQQCQPAS